MQATDVTPNRLEPRATRRRAFTDQLPEKFRLGLVTFSNVAQLLVPPTSDREPVKQALDSLQAEGGTAIGTALETSLSALQPVIEENKRAIQRGAARPPRAPPAVIVLLSDGYSTTGPSP